MIVALSIHIEASKPEEIEDFIAESAIMLDFNYPNVLRLVGVCFDTEDKLPLIVLPYMANGDLRRFLKSKRSSSSETMPEVRMYMASVIVNLQYTMEKINRPCYIMQLFLTAQFT